MSKNLEMYQRWLQTARDDIETAECTRYPNGLPAGTPRENFTADDSKFTLGLSRRIVVMVSRPVNSKK